MLVTRLDTSSQRGIIHGKVAGRRDRRAASSRPDAGSTSWMKPPCSITSAPAPASIVFTSKSVNFVTWRSRFASRLERPDVRDAVAIGDEDRRCRRARRDRCPSSRSTAATTRSYVFRSTIQIGPVLAAAIVAPLVVPRRVHAIGDVRAVGRNLALIAARQRQRRLDAAFDRHGPEARRAARRPRRARRRKHAPPCRRASSPARRRRRDARSAASARRPRPARRRRRRCRCTRR